MLGPTLREVCNFWFEDFAFLNDKGPAQKVLEFHEELCIVWFKSMGPKVLVLLLHTVGKLPSHELVGFSSWQLFTALNCLTTKCHFCLIPTTLNLSFRVKIYIISIPSIFQTCHPSWSTFLFEVTKVIFLNSLSLQEAMERGLNKKVLAGMHGILVE